MCPDQGRDSGLIRGGVQAPERASRAGGIGCREVLPEVGAPGLGAVQGSGGHGASHGQQVLVLHCTAGETGGRAEAGQPPGQRLEPGTVAQDTGGRPHGVLELPAVERHGVPVDRHSLFVDRGSAPGPGGRDPGTTGRRQDLGAVGQDEARRGDVNLMPAIVDASKAYATMGEMCDALREVWGVWRETPVF